MCGEAADVAEAMREVETNRPDVAVIDISLDGENGIELIEQGKECLLGIKNIFNDLITSPMESVKSILKTIHFQRGRNETLVQILKRNAELIEEYYNFMDQLIALEKGA